MDAQKVGGVETSKKGNWRYINFGAQIVATYSDPLTLAAALLGSMPAAEIEELLRNGQIARMA